jgi:hypothetical protein
VGESGFVDCRETKDIYGRDVYIHKNMFEQTQIGDWIRFGLHLNDKGMPQVSWFEKVEGGPMQGTKRAAVDDMEYVKRAAMEAGEGVPGVFPTSF